ncbi:metalloprotease [Bacteroidia bacterium]|nr:metalloprotease [Bacteroidia bacterium]
MQWQGRQGSENVEDRRGQGGSSGGFSGNFGGNLGGLLGGKGCGCGGGIGTIIVILVLWLMGVNPLTLLQLSSELPTQQTQTGEYQSSAEEDSMMRFSEVVLKLTEDVWTDIFNQMGKTYRKPTLVFYTQGTQSGCGVADAAVGPFYCSADEKIYLDLSFFNQMATQFHAGGDFAYAYVIAHEVGHHVQKLLGTLDQVNAQMARSSKTVANELSVRLELQADFYAGVWANHTDSQFHILDPGDIEAALNAASQIGDDTLQKETQGYIQPDSFTHGTSKQRYTWFNKGYKTGDISYGDTFSANPL